MKSHYHPEHYDLSRPIYPAELFDPIRPAIGRVLPQRLNLLDLGCGTGLVWNSIEDWAQKLELDLTLVDPNPALLEIAAAKIASLSFSHSIEMKSLMASAEAIPVQDHSLDVILSGSAWHWFKSIAVEEVARILRPGGCIYVFEYQFPKMESDLLGLNEWVRRQFNETWRFTDQSPRGSLFEMTDRLRNHFDFSQSRSRFIQKSLQHSAESFSEMIFSQARYLDFELRVEKQKALDVRSEVRQQVAARFQDPKTAMFAYRFEGFLFQKRRV